MSSIEETLSRDHDKIDSLFSSLVTLVNQKAENSIKVVSQLKTSLEKHIEWEEKYLFPAVLNNSPAYSNSIESLFIDHKRIKDALLNVESVVESRNHEEAFDLIHNLRIFLEGHNRDEEYGIYVDADRLLPKDIKEKILLAFM